MAHQSLSRYLHLQPGEGGLYRLPLIHRSTGGKYETLSGIGTYGCQTTVGVYVPIDDEFFFAAHIDAHHLDDAFGDGNNQIRAPVLHDLIGLSNQFTVAEQSTGDELKVKIKDILKQHLQPVFEKYPKSATAWDLHFPQQVKDRIYIVRALREIFGLPYTELTDGPTEVAAHGFIARLNGEGAQVSYLRWRNGRVPTDSDRNDEIRTEFDRKFPEQTPVDIGWEPCNDRQWTFGHKHGVGWKQLKGHTELPLE